MLVYQRVKTGGAKWLTWFIVVPQGSYRQGDWTHKSFRPLTVLTFRWNHAVVGSFEGGVFMAQKVGEHGRTEIGSLNMKKTWDDLG